MQKEFYLCNVVLHEEKCLSVFLYVIMDLAFCFLYGWRTLHTHLCNWVEQKLYKDSFDFAHHTAAHIHALWIL